MPGPVPFPAAAALDEALFREELADLVRQGFLVLEENDEGVRFAIARRAYLIAMGENDARLEASLIDAEGDSTEEFPRGDDGVQELVQEEVRL